LDKGGNDSADCIGLPCLPGCIALTVLITCTLSFALVIDDCLSSSSAKSLNRLLDNLEETRQRYRFIGVGYVVMLDRPWSIGSRP
jgi:hypothetical protein